VKLPTPIGGSDRVVAETTGVLRLPNTGTLPMKFLYTPKFISSAAQFAEENARGVVI
jgi:hypothetical protein